jgi:hypothetical protein
LYKRGEIVQARGIKQSWIFLIWYKYNSTQKFYIPESMTSRITEEKPPTRQEAYSLIGLDEHGHGPMWEQVEMTSLLEDCVRHKKCHAGIKAMQTEKTIENKESSSRIPRG